MADQLKLVSSFARFVQGDIKGGEHAHAYRKEVITSALEQAFKGNYSPITEALSLTEGKAKKARAYAAGFANLGPIGSTDTANRGVLKVPYKGALNANENKEARELIAGCTAQYAALFFVAFDAIMAEKAEKKEKKAAPASDAAPVAETQAETARHDSAVALDTSVTGMENLLRTGALTGEQLDRISAAMIDGLNNEQLVELVTLVRVAMDKRLEVAEAASLASAGALIHEAATA